MTAFVVTFDWNIFLLYKSFIYHVLCFVMTQSYRESLLVPLMAVASCPTWWLIFLFVCFCCCCCRVALVLPYVPTSICVVVTAPVFRLLSLSVAIPLNSERWTKEHSRLSAVISTSSSLSRDFCLNRANGSSCVRGREQQNHEQAIRGKKSSPLPSPPRPPPPSLQPTTTVTTTTTDSCRCRRTT